MLNKIYKINRSVVSDKENSLSHHKLDSNLIEVYSWLHINLRQKNVESEIWNLHTFVMKVL